MLNHIFRCLGRPAEAGRLPNSFDPFVCFHLDDHRAAGIKIVLSVRDRIVILVSQDHCGNVRHLHLITSKSFQYFPFTDIARAVRSPFPRSSAPEPPDPPARKPRPPCWPVRARSHRSCPQPLLPSPRSAGRAPPCPPPD